MVIRFASAPCGSGKTYQLIERAIRICTSGDKVLLAQPTTVLAEETEKAFRSRSGCPPLQVFNTNTVGRGVARQLSDYLASPQDDGPEIIICTHQVLSHLPFLAMGQKWHLLIDECPQVHREATHNLPDTHRMITENIALEPYGNRYDHVIVDDEEALKQVAYNKDSDEVFGVLQETARILISPHWQTFVLRESFEALLDGSGKQLTFHSILPSTFLSRFASVFICGANFEDSGIYKLWRNEVEWCQDTKFENNLRYAAHENGNLLAVYYAVEGNWSRGKREDCSKEIREAAVAIFQERPFVLFGLQY